MQLQDRIAIVTGGANGIGRAIVNRLGREGASVVVADIDAKQARRVVAEANGLGYEAMFMKADVTRMAEVKQMARNVLKKFKRIDILVNNAGVLAKGKPSPFYEKTEDAWDYVINVNLKGMFNCTRAVIEHMIRRKSGKIVNISSTSGLVGFPGLVDYSASKAGVIGFTMALAKEVAPYGINVNAVAPGATETEMVKRLMSKMERREISNLKQLSGFGRLAKPEEIAAAVAFLTTKDADFITGQVLPVCGLRNIGRS